MEYMEQLATIQKKNWPPLAVIGRRWPSLAAVGEKWQKKATHRGNGKWQC